MPEPIAPYHERLPELERELAERGSLGVLVLDASPFAAIEDKYGTLAYEEVRQRVFKILEEARGKDYRQGDILGLDRPRGLPGDLDAPDVGHVDRAVVVDRRVGARRVLLTEDRVFEKIAKVAPLRVA